METIQKEIEGVFDGQNMVSESGRLYPVSQNYASISKLVEGDKLKLKISEESGAYYKQLYRVPRVVQLGMVIKENGKTLVEHNGIKYKILPASISYYKLEEGQEVFIIIPKDGVAEWASIEMPIG